MVLGGCSLEPRRLSAMPLEAHAHRLATSLTRRDKLVIGVIVIGALLAVGVGIYSSVTRHSAPPGANCVTVTVPGTMGGGTLRNCGAAARRFCLAEYRLNDAIASACRAHGYLQRNKLRSG